MSPLAFHRKVQTKVRLNPPTLSIVTQPVSSGSIANLGSTSFTGLATVTFPTVGGIGTIGYEWRDQNGVIGVGTQLTLSNLTAVNDTGREIFHRAIYYPDPTRTGIQTFEPGANNSPLDSNSVTLNVRSVITFSQQPTAEGGEEIADETIKISPATPNGTGTINLEDGDFSDFETGISYTLTPSSTVVINAVFGGGEGQSGEPRDSAHNGGKGGKASGRIILQKGFSYILVVGSGFGNHPTPPDPYPYGDKESLGPGPLDISGGGYGAGPGGGNGGGFTGLFVTSVLQSNALLIAGGGGGGAGVSPRVGGHGGGLEGGDENGWNGKGTQTAAGPGFYVDYGDLYAFMNGEALEGGDGQGYQNEDQSDTWVYGQSAPLGGGGGGGGYFGGGAGRSDSNGSPGSYGGAGGSGYIHPDLVTNGTFEGENAGPGTAVLSKVS